MVQAVDVAERILERHAVCEQADVLLELLKGSLGMRTEVSVIHTASEAKCVERTLQCKDICPMEVGQAQVQRTVTQLVGGIDQRLPAGGIDLVALRQVVMRAEQTDGGCGRVAETLIGKLELIDGEPQGGQTRLHVLDGSALHPLLDRLHANPLLL